MRNDTFCHSSTRICSASCRPMPPAPTMPMMVAERVFELDEIKHLARDHGQHLRHQAEADFMQRVAAGGADALDLLLVRTFNGLGEQLAECAEIRHRNRQHAGKGTETDDIDPDQRPDQRIDAADGIEKSPHRKTEDIGRHDVLCRQQADRQRGNRGDRGAEQRDRQGFSERDQIGRQRGARIGRDHHQRNPAELVKAGEKPRRRKVEIDQPEYEDA